MCTRPMWALMVALLVGCVEQGPSLSRDIVIDTLESGRIMIRNRAEGQWDEASRWSLEPVVRIGAVDGSGPHVFGRVVDVAVGPDENVYVLDALAREVRVFGMNGLHIRSIGTSGEGPGELISPYALSFDSAGRLWVADERNRRYTIFSLDGEVLATHPSPIQGGIAVGQVRVTAEGQVLDMAFLAGRGLSALGLGLGDGAPAGDTLTIELSPPPGLVRVTDTGERLVRPAPIGPSQTFEISRDGRLWLGTGAEYEIHALALSGDTVRSIYRTVAATPLDPADQARQREFLIEGRQDGYLGEESDLPMHYPYFSKLVAAEDGQLWVYREDGAIRSFDIFDETGLYLGTMNTTLDAGFSGSHPYITSTHLVGVSVDPLGVQFVEVFRIVKPEFRQ